MFLGLYFELSALFCELLWMPEQGRKNTSAQYDPDENSDFQSFNNNNDIEDNESIASRKM